MSKPIRLQADRQFLSVGHYPDDGNNNENDIIPLEIPFNHLTCICWTLLWLARESEIMASQEKINKWTWNFGS